MISVMDKQAKKRKKEKRKRKMTKVDFKCSSVVCKIAVFYCGAANVVFLA